MWEDYLNLAVHDVMDKYQARRVKARIRAKLLDRYQVFRGEGMESDGALVKSMKALGDPAQLAERLAEPLKHQRGWLWLLAVSQLVLGVAIMAFSLKTESFAALALGRIMALWGMVSTGLQTRRSGHIRGHLKVLRWRLHRLGQGVSVGDFFRMIGVGFGTGLVLALVASLPWNLVTANTFHPVFVSTTSALILSAIVTGFPWVVLRRWLGPSFHVVTVQAWAALAAALGATLLMLWHEGFAPPPLYNWQPEMLILGGWLFNFAVVRLVAGIVMLKDRVMVGFDDDRSRML